MTWVTRKPPRFLPDDVDGRVLFSIATGRRQALAAGLLKARPMFSRLVPAGVQGEGGERLDADVVIWCTGFRPDLRHLQPLGLTTRNGVPAGLSG